MMFTKIPQGELLLANGLRWLIARDRWQKRAMVLVTDAVMCLLAVWLAFSIRLSVWIAWDLPVLVYALAALALFPPIFIATGSYRHIFRFAGSGTILQLAMATGWLAVPLIALFTINQVGGVPRTIAILHPILFFLFAAIARISARYVLVDLLGSGRGSRTSNRCVIFGAGVWGQQLQASLQLNPAFSIIGFTDDDERLHRQRLNGVPVYHSSHLEHVIEVQGIDTVFLAVVRLSHARRRELVEQLSGLGVHVQQLPSVSELVEGRLSISDLREIRIEDLLGREPVAPNEVLLGRIIHGKTVLVTGAGGSIGSELSRQIIGSRPSRLILSEVSEPALYLIERELRASPLLPPSCEIVADLSNFADGPQVDRMMRRWRPDTVFHAAAYKHVPLVEENVISGLRNNIECTMNVAGAARETGVGHFVLISTDKAVRPTNVMGASKRVCELVLQAMAMEPGKTRFSMVRFGNVLGSSGSVVPQFEDQIRKGGPVTLTHRDITRFFMTIPEAAQLVIQAGAMAQGGEVYLLDMGEPVRIYDLARTMVELSGRTVRDANNPEGDIEINEIGLRPGEKLYEELLIDCDSEPTRHPRIMRAREAGLAPDILFPQIERMRDCLASGDRGGALRILQDLVPEYRRETGSSQASAG